MKCCWSDLAGPIALQAASYMRAVLKTLAQCHAHNILHRDIKPGNFMLESDAEDARIKAIDFGLAYPYSEGEDLTELDMQGTPWYAIPHHDTVRL
jgi:calcium-dependent protein kinase